MYRQFFGLIKDPFMMTPDPAFLFLTAEHREALAGLTYAILCRKGFVVLTGDAGTGKTTVLARVLQSIPSTRVHCSVILNPTLTPSEFLEMALADFGIAHVSSNKTQRLLALQRFLLESEKNSKVPVLIIDEAHKLPPDVLEEIRLLSNFEKSDGKLLQIVLAGQSELRDVLNREDLRQLKQRVAVRLSIGALSESDVGLYVQYRWTKAGGKLPHPFSGEAVSGIARYSRGIPRVVNSICDNALMLAFGDALSLVTVEHIRMVAGDLDLLSGQGNVEEKIQRLIHPAGMPNHSEPAGHNRAPKTGDQSTLASGPSFIPVLERYAPPRTSRLSRWVGKLGLVQ